MKYGPVARLVGPAGYTRDLLVGSWQAAAPGGPGGPGGIVPLPLTRAQAPGGAERVRWIAEALKRDALRWICGPRGGGWRVLQVVAGGRRREGRLWDPAIFSRLGLRFSDAPLRLLVASMESRWSPPPLDPALVGEVRARLEQPDPPTGDLLALHRLTERLLERGQPGAPEVAACFACGTPIGRGDEAAPRLRASKGASKEPAPGEAPGRSGPGDACPACDLPLERSEREPPSPREARELDLLALSPLTLLFRPETGGLLDEDERHGPLADRLAPVFRGDRAILLSYLAPSLARAWIAEERRRRRASAPRAQEGYRRAARALRAYVGHAEQRPDAFRPLIAFYRDYVLRAFGGRAPVVEALREQSRAFDRASERDAFLRDAGALFSFGRAIQRRVDLALATPFVDRTEEEKVLLSEYHERFREVAGEVEALRRELQGELG